VSSITDNILAIEFGSFKQTVCFSIPICNLIDSNSNVNISFCSSSNYFIWVLVTVWFEPGLAELSGLAVLDLPGLASIHGW
jgi:hypothetical protein